MQAENALHHLATQAQQFLTAGKYREGVAAYSQLLAKDPNNAQLLSEIGLMACLLGDFEGGRALFQQAVQAVPHHITAQRRLAAVLLVKGNLRTALAQAQKAALPETEDSALCEIFAQIHTALGQPEQAAAFRAKVANLEPPSVLKAEALLADGRAMEAIDLLARALGTPDSQTLGNWTRRGLLVQGTCLRATGAFEEACAAFRLAIGLNPASETGFVQLGMTLALIPRAAEAVACLRAAVQLNPKNADALSRLGVELLRLDRTDEGVAALDAALRLRPDSAALHGFLAAGLLQSGRQDEAVSTLRRAVALQPGDAALHSQLLAALNYIPTPDRATRFADFQSFATRFEQLHPVTTRRTPISSTAGRRIRIGYVSGDFRNHSVAFFVEPLLRHHDRSHFEVFCYMTRPQTDAVTERLRSLADHWRPVAHLHSEALADLVRTDSIDVLVDLASHTAENRLLAFVRQPAPVQVTMIGLMQTTGLKSIGYRVTDSLLDPPGETECFNSERLVRLESGPLVFAPPCDAPEPGPLRALSGAPLTLACTNDLEKVTPHVRALWARVMHELPEARLLFFGRPGNRFVAEMGALGIPSERFIEERRKPLAVFLETHQRIDLALDPFPYNGLTVTLLSAWMGVPCVTWEGATPPARAAASLLRRLGFPEFVADSPDAYVGAVLAQVRNLPKLATIRSELRARVRDRLCDGAKFVTELEQAFRQMLNGSLA